MPRTRVLFLCIGNSCRSQMAEGFARAYGADVIEPASAGLAPAYMVDPTSHKIMMEKNIDLGGAYPKSLQAALAEGCDLIVNMSGETLPAKTSIAVEEWSVRDPVLMSEEQHREIANEIEQLVMQLILKLRASPARKADPQAIRFDSKRKTPRK